MAQSSDYTPIVTYHSNTADAVPTPSLVRTGELAINIADKKIYTKNDSDTIVELTNSGDHDHVAGDITDFYDAVVNVLNLATIEANRPTVTTQAGTAYTLTAEDETSIIRFTSDSAVTVTVPANATLALPVGYIVHLHQEGDGTVTVAGAGGVTVNAGSSLASRNQYSALSLFKLATDTWVLVGDQD